MNIVLTKHPERKYGMGLSMNFGGPTPPPTPYVPKVQVTLTGGTTVDDYFDNNTIPAGYYSGRTDIYSVHIWSGMTIGGEWVFQDCTNLNYAIVNGGGTIVAHCFQGCTKMKNVSISNRYTRLEGWVFSGCTSLSSVTIPDSVTLIGGHTFQGCTSLEEVVLGSGLANVNIQCFDGCISLTNITSYATTAPALGNNVFRNVASDGTLYVPIGSEGYDAWVAALPQNWGAMDISDFHQFASLDDMRTWLPWNVDPENKPQNSLQILYEDGVRLTIDSGNTLQLSTGEQLFIDDGGTPIDPSTGEEATSELLEIFEPYVVAGSSIKVPKDEKEERIFFDYYVGDATPLAGQEQWEEAGMLNNPYSPSIEGWLYDSYVNEYPQEEEEEEPEP